MNIRIIFVYVMDVGLNYGKKKIYLIFINVDEILEIKRSKLIKGE